MLCRAGQAAPKLQARKAYRTELLQGQNQNRDCKSIMRSLNLVIHRVPLRRAHGRDKVDMEKWGILRDNGVEVRIGRFELAFVVAGCNQLVCDGVDAARGIVAVFWDDGRKLVVGGIGAGPEATGY